MEENVLKAIMYVIDYVKNIGLIEFSEDLLREKLTEEGFATTAIASAMNWLATWQNLTAADTDTESPSTTAATPLRVFNDQECQKLSVDVRGFLLSLLQEDIIGLILLESILDRLMALPAELLNLENVQHLILLFMFNQPDREIAIEWRDESNTPIISETLH